MKHRFLALIVAVACGLTLAVAQEKPAFTDAQLLKAAKHKAAVLEYQLSLQALEQRKQQLIAAQAELNKELCGDGTFDFDKDVCIPKPKPDEGKQ